MKFQNWTLKILTNSQMGMAFSVDLKIFSAYGGAPPPYHPAYLTVTLNIADQSIFVFMESLSKT